MKSLIFKSSLLISLCSSQSQAMNVNDLPELDPTEYLNAAALIGNSVDSLQKMNELSLTRLKINDDQIDSCFLDDHMRDLFSEQITFFTQQMLNDTPAMVGSIGSYYGTSTNDQNYFPTSLIHHPLCMVNSTSLSSTIKNIPSQTVIDKLNRFASISNGLRAKVRAGDIEAKKEILSHYSRLFSCLAYTESLSSPDSKQSIAVARKYTNASYRRPAGVEFYEDPAQDQASRLNLGLFQFTPNASGNIQSCLKAWNQLPQNKNNSKCQLPINGTQSEMISILGSSYQSFNAFCGVHKLIQTFAIQVNTKNRNSTFPSNYSNGKLISPADRCVTPHFQAGKAYNHFGPLQNSTSSNLAEVYNCIEKSQNN